MIVTGRFGGAEVCQGTCLADAKDSFARHSLHGKKGVVFLQTGASSYKGLWGRGFRGTGKSMRTLLSKLPFSKLPFSFSPTCGGLLFPEEGKLHNFFLCELFSQYVVGGRGSEGLMSSLSA